MFVIAFNLIPMFNGLIDWLFSVSLCVFKSVWTRGMALIWERLSSGHRAVMCWANAPHSERTVIRLSSSSPTSNPKTRDSTAAESISDSRRLATLSSTSPSSVSLFLFFLLFPPSFILCTHFTTVLGNRCTKFIYLFIHQKKEEINK